MNDKTNKEVNMEWFRMAFCHLVPILAKKEYTEAKGFDHSVFGDEVMFLCYLSTRIEESIEDVIMRELGSNVKVRTQVTKVVNPPKFRLPDGREVYAGFHQDTLYGTYHFSDEDIFVMDKPNGEKLTVSNRAVPRYKTHRFAEDAKPIQIAKSSKRLIVTRYKPPRDYGFVLCKTSPNIKEMVEDMMLRGIPLKYATLINEYSVPEAFPKDDD
jgi:hypothetical protein